jgi:hypothetical protein
MGIIFEMLTSLMGKSAQRGWKRLLLATGGALSLLRCFLYSMHPTQTYNFDSTSMSQRLAHFGPLFEPPLRQETLVQQQYVTYGLHSYLKTASIWNLPFLRIRADCKPSSNNPVTTS